MKRYSFENYRIENGNTSAFDTCRRIGALSYQGARPVVLVGEPGCGKTHLIYSIVNALKANSSKAGLAVVTAGKFPPEVRALEDNPGLVQNASAALLLIDQLEKFDEHADDLAAVAKIFHDCGHLIVAASTVPPDQLEKLPPALRRLLSEGNIISFAQDSHGAEAAGLREQVAELESALAASEQRVTDMQCRLDRLRLALEDERKSNSVYERELEQKRAENEDLLAELELVRETAEDARLQNEAYTEKMNELAAQIESYSAYFAEGEQAQRRQLAELEQGIAALEARPADASAAQLAVTRAECAEAELEAARRAFASIREQLERERDQARTETADIADERNETADSILQLETAHRKVLVEMQQLQQLYAAQSKEFDDLRQEAAAQVAAANANAGELQHEVGRLLALQEQERASAAAEIQAVRDQLVNVAKALGLTATNLSANNPKPAEPPAIKEPGILAVIDSLADDDGDSDGEDTISEDTISEDAISEDADESDDGPELAAYGG